MNKMDGADMMLFDGPARRCMLFTFISLSSNTGSYKPSNVIVAKGNSVRHCYHCNGEPRAARMWMEGQDGWSRQNMIVLA